MKHVSNYVKLFGNITIKVAKARQLLLFTLVFVNLSWPQASYATQVANKADVKAQVAFVTEHLPPYQIQLADNAVGGFATTLIKQALTHTNLTASFRIYPWTRAFNMAKQNKNTCIYSIARTPQRETLFNWLQVIATTNSTFIGLASNTRIAINTIEDAKNYRIAVLRDDATHETLLNNGFVEGKNLFIVNNTYSLLRLLSQRKGIDLILADIMTVNHRARFDGFNPNDFKSHLAVNKKPLDFYLACSLNTEPSIIAELNKAINITKKSGFHQQLLSQYQ